MAQRSITTFFGAKSPQSSAPATTASEATKETKVLASNTLTSPNRAASPEKPLKKAQQLMLAASPQKTLILSPKKKAPKAEKKSPVAKTKKAKASSDDSKESSPRSPNNSDSENGIPDAKVIRKRRRISSSSSSASSTSSSSAADSDSLSTAFSETEKDDEMEIVKVEEKKPAAAGKKKTEKKTKAKSPANKPAPKKKTPAKNAKLEPSAKVEPKVETSVKTKEEAKTTASTTKAEPGVAPTATKPNEYDPTQANYDPIISAPWKEGEKTPFICLARTLDYAEKTSSRLRTMETVANFFASVTRLSATDLPATVYLCLGVVAPAHLGIETSVGEGVLLKALAAATGRPIAKIREDLQQRGDIGEVAESSRQVQRQLSFAAQPARLTISGVFGKLREIAAMHGASSVTQRVDTISRLLTTCQPVEAKFLVRLLTGKLRVGLAEQSVLIALGNSAVYAKCTTPKLRSKYWEDKSVLDSVAKAVRLAFAHCPDVDRITLAIKEAIADPSEDPIAPLLLLPDKCPIVPGLPVKPMLAQPAKSLHEIIEKLGEQATEELKAIRDRNKDSDDQETKPGRVLACEYKYDGERAQIHVFMPPTKEGEDKPVQPTVKIFSRNQEDHTVRYSEVANRIASEAVLPCAEGFSLIIDSEIVAVDTNGRHLPFQMLAARKRKETTLEDVAAAAKAAKQPPVQTAAPPPTIPAYRPIAFVFDCIYINGKSLVHDTLLERRRKIAECIKPIDGLVEWATSCEVDIDKDEHEVEERVGTWLEEAVKAGCEGLIVKTATSRYMVARRAPCWLKLKKDYIETEGGGSGGGGMGGDSVDLVVVAGYWGSGKRTGRLGAFLLASYDSMDDQYETVCKLGTGLSDELLDQLTEQLMPSARAAGAPPPPYVKRSPGLPEPNVWLEPSVVWEIRAADLSLSNVHTSGLGTIPGAPDRGVSLRFPRYVRARPDKKPEEATTSHDMYRRYANQQQVQHAADGKTKTAVDDDFY